MAKYDKKLQYFRGGEAHDINLYDKITDISDENTPLVIRCDGVDTYVPVGNVTDADATHLRIQKAGEVKSILQRQRGFFVSMGSWGGNDSNVYSAIHYKGELYVGGKHGLVFYYPSGTSIGRRTLGGAWRGIGNTRSYTSVYCMVEYKGELYVGGSAMADYSSYPNTLYFAKWNGDSWSDVFNQQESVSAYTVRTMLAHGESLYVGGEFSKFAGVGTPSIIEYDGSSWVPMGGGVLRDAEGAYPTTRGFVYCLAIHEGNLYVGGKFHYAGGDPALNIAKWDGTSWSAVGDGLGNEVRSLASWGGKLYAVTSDGISEWDGTSWVSPEFALEGPARKCVAHEERLLIATHLHSDGDPLYPYGRVYLYSWDGSSLAKIGEHKGGIDLLSLLEDGVYIGGITLLTTTPLDRKYHLSRFHEP